MKEGRDAKRKGGERRVGIRRENGRDWRKGGKRKVKLCWKEYG